MQKLGNVLIVIAFALTIFRIAHEVKNIEEYEQCLLLEDCDE